MVVTFEGNSEVLFQECTKYLISQYEYAIKKGTFQGTALDYLNDHDESVKKDPNVQE